MTTETKIFNELKAAVLAIPEVKNFQLWNNQLSELQAGRQNVFKFPAVFVEFDYRTHDQQSDSRQRIGLITRLYVCVFDLNRPETDLFEIKAKVHAAAAKVWQRAGGPPEWLPLTRVAQQQDSDHGNTPLWVMDYETAFVDNSAEEILLHQLTAVNTR